MLKQLIKPPPGSHQIERISQTKNRTGLLVWATQQQTIYKSLLTRLLGRPQPQMYPPVALNQYTLVNRTHKHFIYIYMLQGPTNILRSMFIMQDVLSWHFYADLVTY